MAIAIAFIFSTDYAFGKSKTPSSSSPCAELARKEKAKMQAKQKQDSCIKALNRLNKDSIILSIMKVNNAQNKQIALLKEELQKEIASVNEECESNLMEAVKTINNSISQNSENIAKNNTNLTRKIKKISKETAGALLTMDQKIDKKTPTKTFWWSMAGVLILFAGLLMYAQNVKTKALNKVDALRKYVDDNKEPKHGQG